MSGPASSYQIPVSVATPAELFSIQPGFPQGAGVWVLSTQSTWIYFTAGPTPNGSDTVAAAGGGVWRQMGFAAGATFPIANSIVDEVTAPFWRVVTPAAAPKVLAQAGSLGDPSVPLSAAWVNVDGAAPGTGVLERVVGAPGAGSYRVDVAMAKPLGAPNPNTIVVDVFTFPAGVLIATASHAVTSTAQQTYSLGPFNLLAATDYKLRLSFNGNGSSAQASAFVASVALVPVNVPAFIQDPFFRVAVTPDMLWDGALQNPAIINNRNYSRNAFSRAIVRTNAPYLWTQSYDEALVGSVDYDDLGVKVDGVSRAPLALLPGAAVEDYRQILLKAGRAYSTVEITTSFGADNDHTGLASGWRLNTQTAFYVPQGYDFQVRYPSHSAQEVVMYGDSIASGALSTSPQLMGFTQQMRVQWSGSIAFEVLSGARMFFDCGSPGVFAPVPIAGLDLCVRRLLAHRPKIIYSAIGTNDYGGAGGAGSCTAANFQLLYAAWLDRINALAPNVKVIAQTPLRRLNEATANTFGAGNALPDYRTAITNACAGRAWATVRDGLAIFPSLAHFPDGIHLDNAGEAIWASDILVNALGA